ncbi:MAG: cellulase family glycosylhydrolase [Chloroflexota bacterium]|nr:cellulase family glycosylhydrolase [Chloroflexota bacterium]
MLSRRNFLKVAVTFLGSAVATACGRAVSVSTPDPTLTVKPPTATLTPTATFTPTVAPTPAATATSAATATPTPGAPEFVTVRGDQFYFRGARFPIKGFNYYPKSHPWRMFNLGEWDARTTEQELLLGSSLGANVVRVFIDYPYSIGVQPLLPPETRQAAATPTSTATPPQTPMPTPTLAFVPPTPQYLQNVREFIDIAGRQNFKVILTLFDNLDPTMYLPPNYWIAEAYLNELVPRFANDPRILCWDLQNEPDRAFQNVGDQPVLTWFQRVSTQIRALDPNHLQTIGWIDRARGKYFADLDNYLDFWCFHFYDKVDRLSDLIQFYKSRTAKPILLEEFGLATGGPGPDGQHTEPDQASHYSTVLALLEGYKMCGSVFWILTDFPKGLAGNPPTPDDSPENHFGVFRLDYSEKPAAGQIRYFWKSG